MIWTSRCEALAVLIAVLQTIAAAAPLVSLSPFANREGSLAGAANLTSYDASSRYGPAGGPVPIGAMIQHAQKYVTLKNYESVQLHAFQMSALGEQGQSLPFKSVEEITAVRIILSIHDLEKGLEILWAESEKIHGFWQALQYSFQILDSPKETLHYISLHPPMQWDGSINGPLTLDEALRSVSLAARASWTRPNKYQGPWHQIDYYNTSATTAHLYQMPSIWQPSFHFARTSQSWPRENDLLVGKQPNGQIKPYAIPMPLLSSSDDVFNSSTYQRSW